MKGVLFAIALFAALTAVAVPAAAGPGSGAPAPGTVPIKADLNGDKIFDDLAAQLAGLSDNASVSAIVSLDDPATTGRIATIQQSVGALAALKRFSILKGFAATLTKRQILLLTRLPFVAHVEANDTVHALNDSAQAAFGVTKARIDDPVLDGNCNDASNPTCSPDVYGPADEVAAVIDTGIDANHLDLDQGKVIAFANCTSGTCVDATPIDDNGHGTHVSATIAGDGDARADRLYKGVAPGAALVGVKVLNASGSGSDANVVNGIQWVVDHKDQYGIEAINLSLGSSGCSNGTDATSVAVNNAAAAGIVVAVAAGNDGPGTCTVGSPGAAADAITVGAMSDQDSTQAYFSSRGKTADGRIKPDVSAPGVNITSAKAGTTNAYVNYSGTSMATPFVAGVALLMRDVNPALTPQDVKNDIMSTAVDWGRGGDNKTVGSTGADIDYGAGRLDGYRAIAAADPSLLTPPPVAVHQLKEGTLATTGAVVDYSLSVVDTQFPIGATLIIPGLSAGSAYSPDFDLYLYSPSGALLKSSERITRQEEVGYNPDPASGGAGAGTYKLRVKSYSGSGAYFVDISAGLGVDTTPPTITSVAPADAALDVATNAKVSITFSEPMNQASAQGAFSLIRTSDSSAVAGSFSWSGNTMTFTPSSALAALTQYTATETTAANDGSGNALAAGQTWSFTTAAAPPPPTSTTVYPTTVTIQNGTLTGGNAASLQAVDTNYLRVASNSSFTRTSAWYGTFTGLPSTLTSLKVTYRGLNSRSCTQTVSIYRYTTGSWTVLDSRSVGTTEVEIADLAPSGSLSDYRSGGQARVRVRCQTTAGTFTASGNLLKLVYQ